RRAQLRPELGVHVLALPSAPSLAPPEPGAGHCSQVDFSLTYDGLCTRSLFCSVFRVDFDSGIILE
ncbi:hypothetical protein A2U01_0085828, partial [Trifolium medium]|nr:hypothetical protein [Trifolium medium]